MLNVNTPEADDNLNPTKRSQRRLLVQLLFLSSAFFLLFLVHVYN